MGIKDTRCWVWLGDVYFCCDEEIHIEDGSCFGLGWFIVYLYFRALSRFSEMALRKSMVFR